MVLLFGLAALLGLILGASLMGIAGAARRRRMQREAEEEQELLQNLYNDTRLHGARLQAENVSLKDSLANISDRDERYEREVKQLGTELKAAQMSLQVKEKDLAEKESLLSDLERNQSQYQAPTHPESVDQTRHDEALEKERNEGIKAGLKDGLERGRLAGLAEGRELGREEARKEAAALSKLSGASGFAANASEPPTLIKRARGNKENLPSTSDTGLIPDDQIIPTLPEAELTANVEAYDLSDLEDLVNEDL